MTPCRGRAFSLVELCVCMTVLALLLTLAAASLAAVRSNSRRLVCTQRAGFHVTHVAQYAADHRDSLPAWFSVPQGSTETLYWVQSVAMMANVRWERYTGIPRNADVYWCMENRRGERGRTSTSAADDQTMQVYDYRASTTMWLQPQFLDPAAEVLRASDASGASPQHLAAVRFPSDKVAVWENHVFHAFEGSLHNQDAGPLHAANNDASAGVAFFDGHAAAKVGRAAELGIYRAGYWGNLPYDTTAWGVWGRDTWTAPER